MAVAPDLLLTSVADIKPRTTPAKAPESKAGADKDGPSSFSKVYANERQGSASARQADSAKAARERQASRADDGKASAEAAANSSEVAESGKALPSEAADDSTDDLDSELSDAPQALDPLLLFGLTGELPAEPVTSLVISSALGNASPDSASDNAMDEALTGLEPLSAEKLALNLAEQSKQQSQASKLTTPSTEQGLLAAALSEGAAEPEAEALELPELQLQELTGKSLEAMKEGTANDNPENFVSRLNALSQAVSQPTTQAARAAVVGQPVAMQQGGWSEAVVDRVMLMSSQNLKSAEIQLEPAELGRLDVRISVNQEQSQVAFSSPHAGVREALDAQMNRLREMFAQQGLGALDVSVSDQSLQQSWQGQQDSAGARGSSRAQAGGEDDGLISSHDGAPVPAPRARSLVDYYA
jgi:flagellar hook-length control protein FliK